MKTLKLFIKTSSFNKINDFMCSILSNKSLMEEATKCLFRTSLRSTHSTRMCFTVSGHWQVPQPHGARNVWLLVLLLSSSSSSSSSSSEAAAAVEN